LNKWDRQKSGGILDRSKSLHKENIITQIYRKEKKWALKILLAYETSKCLEYTSGLSDFKIDYWLQIILCDPVKM
jgi:hypothetical protein